MASDLVPYQFPGTGHNIRVIERDGEPWFIAGDVALALGYRDAYTATRMLTEAEKGTHSVCTPGYQQEVTIVSEGGLYRMVMRSNKEKAVEFQLWIAHDVLPSIRKTGRYVVPKQAAAPDIALTPEDLFAQSVAIFAQQRRDINGLRTDVDHVSARVDGIEQRTGWFVALAYAKLNKLPCDKISLQRFGKEAARIARREGIEAWHVPNEAFGYVNSYPEEIWREASSIFNRAVR